MTFIDVDFGQNARLSGMRLSRGAAIDGECAVLAPGASVYSTDYIAMDKSRIEFDFSVPDGVPTEFVCGYNGYYATGGGLSMADGAIAVRFDADGNTAEIRRGTGMDGDYQTLLKSFDVSALNIRGGGRYVMSVEKDTVNRYVIEIHDALCPDMAVSAVHTSSEVPGNPAARTGYARGWGGPYIKCDTGGPLLVHSVRMCSTAPACPKIAVWGDSYVENAGRNPLCGYGGLLKQALDGNVFLSGHGGATSLQTKRRAAFEKDVCAPRYIIYNVGVNDSFFAPVAEYKEQIGELTAMAEAKGAEPILITIPRVRTDTLDNLAYITEVNPWVRSCGYRYIDVAAALSTGDGLTADPEKFMSDLIHPNLAGGQAIFGHIRASLPDLLDKD